jgi:hypothetical protein
MTIGPVLLELLTQIENNQYSPEKKACLKELIGSAAVDATKNPRDDTEGNRKLLYSAVLVALGTVQDLYGIGDDTELHPFPEFVNQPQSQIAPLMDNHSTVAIVLGNYVRTWEEVFYDICHESLHLLNPVLNVRDSRVQVSALEEGVAVKFAEHMYGKYIKPYCKNIPSTSPVGDIQGQYFKAYCAAKKIPDEVLHEVRIAFGKFSSINDVEKFAELVGAYLNEEEIEILMQPVKYPT